MNMRQNNISLKIEKSRTIGLLFILAFLFYGIGRSLFESNVLVQKYIGTSLITINSVLVFLIGFFLRKTIRKATILIGNIYFLSRTIEAIALMTITINLISDVHISMDYGYFIAMFVLGAGSIPMCYTLYKHLFIPKWLGLWGIIGYTLLSFGFFMELFRKPWSMYLLGPGALWEVTFAIWLILKKNTQ